MFTVLLIHTLAVGVFGAGYATCSLHRRAWGHLLLATGVLLITALLALALVHAPNQPRYVQLSSQLLIIDTGH